MVIYLCIFFQVIQNKCRPIHETYNIEEYDLPVSHNTPVYPGTHKQTKSSVNPTRVHVPLFSHCELSHGSISNRK